jgi:hypothetical protein
MHLQTFDTIQPNGYGCTAAFEPQNTHDPLDTIQYTQDTPFYNL